MCFVQGKPTKYRLREEVTRGLVTGKLYSLALINLYRETLGGQGNAPGSLHHWDIIKILSRRGVYVAKPSDMKLTEGTLRQKPIRIVSLTSKKIKRSVCLRFFQNQRNFNDFRTFVYFISSSKHIVDCEIVALDS
jgi:hypothetical protein